MTKQQAKDAGAIRVKQFTTGHIEATLTTVRGSADFRYRLEQQGIEFTSRFAMAGKAITYRWKEQV